MRFFLDGFISFKPEVLVDSLPWLVLFGSYVFETEADVVEIVGIARERVGVVGGH